MTRSGCWDADCKVGTVLAWDASCTFQVTEALVGQPGDSRRDVFTAKAEDDTGRPASDTADATVTFTNVKRSRSPRPRTSTVVPAASGGSVTYTVTVVDKSVQPVDLTELTDDLFGDITPDGHNTALTETDCVVPQTLAEAGADGDSYSCTFSADLSAASAGVVDGVHKNTVTGIAYDNEKNKAMDSDDAVVGFTYVEKSVTTVGPIWPGTSVEYSVTLKNTSQVEVISDLVDVLPAGVTFSKVTGDTPPESSRDGQKITGTTWLWQRTRR